MKTLDEILDKMYDRVYLGIAKKIPPSIVRKDKIKAKADLLKLLLTEGEIKKIAKAIPSTAEINGIQMINFKLLSQALHNAQKKKLGG